MKENVIILFRSKLQLCYETGAARLKKKHEYKKHHR